MQPTTTCEPAPPNVTSITDKPKPTTTSTTTTTTVPTTTFPCHLNAQIDCTYNGDRKSPKIFTEEWSVCYTAHDKFWALLVGKNPTHRGMKIGETMELRVCDSLLNNGKSNKFCEQK